MSRPRYAWWGYVREILRRYPKKTTAQEGAAVRYAIERAQHEEGGGQCMEIVRMVFFDKTHTLQGAAQRANCDYETAKRWQRRFMHWVAEGFRCDGLV